MKVNNSFNVEQSKETLRAQKAGRDNRKSNNSLSIDDFLKIMAAEIQNQNPMDGDGGSGGKTDYISQLAQFTTLEQMDLISENLNTLNYMGQQQYAFSLIGKKVSLVDEGKTIRGIVDKAKIQNGFATIEVNGQDYYLGSLVEVGNINIDGEVDHEL